MSVLILIQLFSVFHLFKISKLGVCAHSGSKGRILSIIIKDKRIEINKMSSQQRAAGRDSSKNNSEMDAIESDAD